MAIVTDTITAPTHWACYLLNGDMDDMTDQDITAAEAYFGGWHVTDAIEDSDRFTWSFQLYGGDAQGGEVCDYTVYRFEE